ncbi:hypothetical protein B9Z19DRAFT_1069563 [Tuber borchii]|uniref:Uncharacterized protein n=1 Tax=Tuber borchii TaxID=42251 RepID=A0A2T6ZB37_TUBBO|nr:hypothetical protein B9Z19DRAFT_1069563 [Tuber borchii]
MPSAYKWKPLPASTHGLSANPETIRQNKNRTNLSHLETAFKCGQANRGNRLKLRRDFARGYHEYQELDDKTKAEVDQEMFGEETEILEQEPTENFIHVVYPLGRLTTEHSTFFVHLLPPTILLFSMNRAAGSPVAATLEPTVGLSRAATFGTSRTREPISGRTRFKIRLGRRNPGTNCPEGTHTSPSRPTGGEDRTSESQLTADDMKGHLDMTVQEDELDEKGRLWIYWDGNGSEDSDEIYGKEMIYEEEEGEEVESNDDGNDDNNNDYCDDGDRSENGYVDMLGTGEISGSSLGRASWDWDRSHSAPSTCVLYGNAAENRFWACTQEI